MGGSWKKYLSIVGPVSVIGLLLALFVPDLRRLVALFFYSIPANSFIPVPHELGLIYFGRYHHPALVALVAACGTVLACFIDYRVIGAAFQTEKLKKVRQGEVYRGAVYYFLKAPFFCVLVAAALPFIPFYIFRVLSPTSGYALKRYSLAVFMGRLPRYFVFAFMGSALDGPNLAITLVLILCVCAILYRRVRSHLRRKSRECEPQTVPEFHRDTVRSEESVPVGG